MRNILPLLILLFASSTAHAGILAPEYIVLQLEPTAYRIVINGSRTAKYDDLVTKAQKIIKKKFQESHYEYAEEFIKESNIETTYGLIPGKLKNYPRLILTLRLTPDSDTNVRRDKPEDIYKPLTKADAVDGKTLDKEPRMIEYPMPLSPRYGQTGSVVLQIVINQYGTVSSVTEISSDNPNLVKYAKFAMLYTRFSQPLKDKKPVNAHFELPINFVSK